MQIAKLIRPSIARAAIFPVVGMLAVIAVSAIVILARYNQAKTTASLLEKARLTARVIAPNAAAAVWRFDTQSGARILQSLASDPDFASGILVDDNGEEFANFRNGNVRTAHVTARDVAALLGEENPKDLKVTSLHEFADRKRMIVVVPLIIAERERRSIGYMVLSFSNERAAAAARQEIITLGSFGALTLIAVSTLLAWILSGVTRPIREITGAMNQLSAGEHDTQIPAHDRADEIGAMARALVIFKETSIERDRLEYLARSLEQKTDELRREGEKVAHLANHDTMTGLLNRAAFSDRLNEAFAEAKEKGRPFAVVCLDLDHFKDVNDTLGHQMGDLLLQCATRRLRNVLRRDDVIGRLGGDEFAVLVLNVDDTDIVAELARRINEALASPFILQGNEVHVSSSIGIAIFTPETISTEEMMVQADLALYQVKQRGRNGFCFHSPNLDHEVQERVAITADLHTALSKNELELEYQPQIEISSNRIVGFEALVRWNHPTRGRLSPGLFVPIAETTGLIITLGRWIFEECCRQIKQWNDEGVTPAKVAINISAAQFKAAPHLEKELKQLFERYDLDPSLIELELTEYTLMEMTELQNGLIDRIRALGISIAIDDFGTGYSSLGYLRSQRVNRLKIAQQFIDEIATNPSDAAIVRATIGLAGELGIDVVAEGVERMEQLLQLRQAGCRCAQGFYFSRPVSAAAAAALWRQGVIDPVRETAETEDQQASYDDASAA